MPEGPAILWFRGDLRLRDNEALLAAATGERAVIPVFILDDERAERWAAGGASRWWLHGSLAALAGELESHRSRLVLRRGESLEQLREIVAETGVGAVCWNRIHDPATRLLDEAVRRMLTEQGVEVSVGAGQLLFDPEAVRSRSGGPFKVFTPFWRHCRNRERPQPVKDAVPEVLNAPAHWPCGDALEGWALRAQPGRAVRLTESGDPGESGAQRRLAEFVARAMDAYGEDRDRPALDGTSRLSAALHFGELTPRQVWAA